MATEITPSSLRQSSLSKRTQTILKVLMVLLSPIILLGLLEGTAYWWEKRQADGPYAWELVASRRIELVYFYSPGAGYTLMKPSRHYEWRGIPVDINSHGLRGPEIGYEKPEGVVRILNMGDSVAMGWGVREEETYGRQLEKSLNQVKNNPISYEVINAGVPGWNLENVFSYLQAEGLKYDPDLVVLEITIVNDIYGQNALIRTNPHIVEWFRAHTYFWPFLAIQRDWIKARSAGKEKPDVLNPPSSPGQYFPLDGNAEQWDVIRAWIELIDRVIQDRNIPFLLTLFPLEYQVIDLEYTRLPQKLLTNIADEMKIPIIDLLPAFQEACSEKPGGRCRLRDGYLFADVWMHPSRLGHAVAFEEIREELPAVLENP